MLDDGVLWRMMKDRKDVGCSLLASHRNLLLSFRNEDRWLLEEFTQWIED